MLGTFTKNLLLKDKRGRLFLVVAEEARSIDLRTLHAKIGARGRLGFAPPDTVREVLGVEPGALTPLALIHDGNHATTVVLDARIMNDTQLNFHPLVNTESIGLSPAQLMRFIAATWPSAHRRGTRQLKLRNSISLSAGVLLRPKISQRGASGLSQ